MKSKTGDREYHVYLNDKLHATLPSPKAATDLAHSLLVSEPGVRVAIRECIFPPTRDVSVH